MQNLANLSNLSGLGVSGSSLFKPNALFRDGEQGVWFDPSDMSTLFQDSLGTIPVTDVEQPVGLMLDKSKGTPTWTNNPAPPGFRVPTSAEWGALVTAEGITNGTTAFGSTLKLSSSGYRNHSNGRFALQGSNGYYWSSSVSGSSALNLAFYSSSVNPSHSHNRAYGFSVRPIWDGEGTPPSTITFNGLEYGVVQALDGKYWLDRNLGATRVATAVNDSQAYGYYYQWGRGNDGHQLTTSGTTATLSSTDTPGHGNFITTSVAPSDWRSPQNDMLWQKFGAFQATSAKRPTLSARVNMLVNTDTLSTQDVTVAKQDYVLRFEGTGSVRDTVPLGQTSRQWYGMTTLGSDVYASVYGGNIYKQTGGMGDFVALGQATRTWRGMTTLGSDVYAVVNNGDIYKQTGGVGNFVALGQTSRQWYGIATLGSDVYASVDDGDIYKQTGGVGDFVALGQTTRAWRGMTTLGSDVYASVYGGNIYKQTGGMGDFVALNQTSRNWLAMTTLGSDVYAAVYGGDIYKQTGGVGNFVALGQISRQWYGMTTLGSDIYATVYGGDIYKISGTPKTAGSYTVTSGAGAMRLVVEGSVSNADLRPTNVGSLPSYQRVGNVDVTPSDYDSVGFPKYLKFDGVDDSLEMSAIDFSSTDEMNVFAGVRKLDSVPNFILELSPTVASNNGAFNLRGATTANPASEFSFSSRGTSASSSAKNEQVSPLSAVLTGIGDISSDTNKLRINGSQVAQSTGDQGTGNYGNYPLYIGGRGGSSFYFMGNLYQLLVRGKLSTDLHITKIEKFISKKTGL